MQRRAKVEEEMAQVSLTGSSGPSRSAGTRRLRRRGDGATGTTRDLTRRKQQQQLISFGLKEGDVAQDLEIMAANDGDRRNADRAAKK